MIFVSLPKNPDVYPSQPGWHAQMSHFVFGGLRRRFGESSVQFLGWNEIAELGRGDLLVTCLPNANYTRTSKIIGVENDTLIPDRWSKPVFDKFGLHAKIDDLRWAQPLIRNAVGFCVLTNDVALRKLAAGDPATVGHVEHFRSLVGGNYKVQPHPIDKTLFQRFFKTRLNRSGWLSRHRMLVYHRDWRKNSAQAIELLREMGYREGREFSVVGRVRKHKPREMKQLSSRYNIVFSGSYSESGPINLLEYLLQGFLVAGHEDWWDGYGLLESVWSYDPARRHSMEQNFAYLLDPANVPALEGHRNRILDAYRLRQDNEWNSFCDSLAEVIRTAMS